MATRYRATLLPGPLSETLDHMSRMICVGITVLRDSNRQGSDGSGMRKIEREEQKSEVRGQKSEIGNRQSEIGNE